MATQDPEPGWAATSGHVQLAARTAPTDARRVDDRLAIVECVHRYGWGYDERDTAVLGDCFTADGVWQGSIMGRDTVGPFVGRDAVLAFLTGFWTEQTDQRRHVFTNVIVDDLRDDTAVAHAYLILTATSGATMAPVTNGPYRFEMRRDGGIWRMATLSAGFDAPF